MMSDRLLPAPELAEYLAVPLTWVWSSARTGRIPCLRVGRYVRFDLDAVLAALGTNGQRDGEGGGDGG